MKLNAFQAQEKYNVNRSTIGRWIKAKKLSADQDGYFEESDFLVIFRASAAWQKWRKKHSEEEADQITANLPLDEPNQLTGAVDNNSNTGSPPLKGFAKDKFDKLSLGNMKMMEDIREKRRKNAFGDGKIINRSLVKRFIGEMGEIDNTEWRSLPIRVKDDLLAICSISDPEIAIGIVKRLEEEIFVILKSIQRSQTDFLNSLPVENKNV